MIGYSTGIDWSGDAGDPSKDPRPNPFLVIAACQASFAAEARIKKELNALKLEMGLGAKHVFKYANSSDKMRDILIRRVTAMPVTMTAGVIDKRSWTNSFLRSSTGTERIMNAISDLVRLLPDHVVCGQRLLVDMNRGEQDFVRELKRTVRAANQLAGRQNFGKIAPRPDHRSDAQLIQIADIFSGYIRAEWGNHTRITGDNIQVVLL